MPLHLLGKKSWNVYNPAAIERVRADEAAAAAREEAHDKRLQEYEAARRLSILRGEEPPPPPSPPTTSIEAKAHDNEDRKRQHLEKREAQRKRRRLDGEDDTDRDIRLAGDALHPSSSASRGLVSVRRDVDANAPIADHTGHIQLFAPPSTRDICAQKNADAEAEKKRREREAEDQYTLRFSNAAGFKNDVGTVPWYATSKHSQKAESGYSGTEEVESGDRNRDYDVADRSKGKDVFGNDDPRRARRDEQRLSAADPMAAMAKAQTRLKEVGRERDAARAEREKELAKLQEEQEAATRARRRRRKSRNVQSDEESLDGFSLDTVPKNGKDQRPDKHQYNQHHHQDRREEHGERSRSRKHRGEHRSRHRHRSRSRSKERGGGRDRERYRDKRLSRPISAAEFQRE